MCIKYNSVYYMSTIIVKDLYINFDIKKLEIQTVWIFYYTFCNYSNLKLFKLLIWARNSLMENVWFNFSICWVKLFCTRFICKSEIMQLYDYSFHSFWLIDFICLQIIFLVVNLFGLHLLYELQKSMIIFSRIAWIQYFVNQFPWIQVLFQKFCFLTFWEFWCNDLFIQGRHNFELLLIHGTIIFYQFNNFNII